jgi:adenosylcobinamide kinase/adenosylcobinamide-phosphate guanylyltransferase
MPKSHRNSVMLVLGGARSGKSRFALQVASKAASVTFVATARASDEEMRTKIECHRSERPAHWKTREEPLNIAEAISCEGESSNLVIVDCLTMFAANLMEAHGENQAAIQTAVSTLSAVLRVSKRGVVLVSNEVGGGVVPEYASGRQFRDLLGELNQRVAAIADHLVMMVAGLPLPIKGSIEEL